jgi:diaminohydroxyphosphoribosylaminopyrimidine deaminase / 5-amino-6-(5-phosphoribosylamino)uracil reductase
MIDEKYMQRCIQLALKGRANVSPNPMVGCVIVHQNIIIGEGFHAQYGQAHAEVNAINNVKDKTLLPFSTVYVSLEPCAHFGKTPPCVNQLIEHKIPKVIIGCIDTFSQVAGKGIEKLKAAGVQVELNVLEKECRELNKQFFTFHEKKRPYIILKWAETANGYIAGNNKQISGKNAQLLLHQWRSEEHAFLIGTNTLLEDNPQLNSRLFSDINPIRIAVDFDLKSNNRPLHFLDNTQPTLLLNGQKNEDIGHIKYVQIKDKEPQTIVNALYHLNIQSVVIEGGKQLLESFINAQLVNEYRILKSKNLTFTEGLKAPHFNALLKQSKDLGEDTFNLFF